MEFKQGVRAGRSCRSFEDSRVPEKTIAERLKAGTWAPSPLNQQPWKFLVVTDPVKKVASCGREL